MKHNLPEVMKLIEDRAAQTSVESLNISSLSSIIARQVLSAQSRGSLSDETICVHLLTYLFDTVDRINKQYSKLCMQMPPAPIEVNGKRYVYVGPPWAEEKLTDESRLRDMLYKGVIGFEEYRRQMEKIK